MKKKLCIVITDAISFNFLMNGQLEYLQSLNKYEITLISGGDDEQINTLKNRKIGTYFYFPFYREINLLNDFVCFFKLIVFFIFHRFDTVIYSTPKALLLTSLSAFFTFQKNRVAIIRGRAYENFTGRKRQFFELLDKLSLGASTKSIFISKSLRNEFIKDNIVSLKKTKVLNHGSSNGLNLDWIKGTIEIDKVNEFKHKINYLENDFISVVVGRVCAEKGVLEVKKIFDKLKTYPSFKLVMVGRVEDATASNVIKQLSIYDNFFHFDQVSDVRVFFKLANIHLFLSHREGFGNVALEAAGFNVPTFGYDVVGVKDSVSNGISGKLFPFLNTNKIIEELESYITNKKNFQADYPSCADWAFMNFNSFTVWAAYEKEFY